MTKRRDLIRHIERQGYTLLREGARHTIYANPAKKQTAAIPRHTEIADLLVRKICIDLGVSLP
ncbi:MAG: type II toxin-antitoxin system HicA family toxin [Chloroflexi bacterium]|nr:type II toxin-antitoxin system HicA family toxin [Chloroflexota bacterium]